MEVVGGNKVWKFGGNLKPTTSGKQFVRKNSDPFTSSLSRTSSMCDKPSNIVSPEFDSNNKSSLSMLVRAILFDKREDVPTVTESGKQERHLVATVGKFSMIWNFQQVKHSAHNCYQNQQCLKSCYCYNIVLKDKSIVESMFMHDRHAVSDSPEAPLVVATPMKVTSFSMSNKRSAVFYLGCLETCENGQMIGFVPSFLQLMSGDFLILEFLYQTLIASPRSGKALDCFVSLF